MVIFRIALILVWFILPAIGHGQTAFNVYNDGLTDLVLESGLTATILGGYVSQTNTNDGQLDNQSTLRLTGNWANNNSNGSNVFESLTGSVELVGTTEQTIGGSENTTFNDLTINNTATSGGVTVNTTTDIENSLTLTDGILTTFAASPLVMNAGSTSSEGSIASYVDGPMQKIGITAFTFPLGDRNSWARLAIGTPNSTTTFQAQYLKVPFSNTTSMASSPTPVLNNVSRNEYWSLTRVTGTGFASVTLYWESSDFSNITDCNDLKLAQWNGSAWENNYNTSGFGSCSGNGSGLISSSTNVTSFVGPFTFGSLLTNPVNPLPVELISFKATAADQEVELLWSTASELNNDFFTIEKSRNATDFEVVTTVEGSGTTKEVQKYSAVDKFPTAGLSYYRLKQTDYDGLSSYSSISTIFWAQDRTISVFPNPFDGNAFQLDLGSFKDQKVGISVYNNMGRLMHFESIIQEEGSSAITINLKRQLTPGIYHIIGTGNIDQFHRRLIKK